MKVKTETVEVRHTKAHDSWRHSGLHSRAGYGGGRIVELVLGDETYVGIVYPFSWSRLEDFANNSRLRED